MYENPAEVAKDVYAIAQIAAVPALLDVLCEITGMGFAAVARVSDVSWTVCAVKDKINFGLKVADQLPLESTLCIESRRDREPIVIDCVSNHPRYRAHHTPKTYRIESYISVPIVLPDGHYFGNLCAVDPAPAKVSPPVITNTFTHFASLIAFQLASETIVERAQEALRIERAAGKARDSVIKDISETLLSPVRAMREAIDTISGRADDLSAVKSVATRIRTNALRISNLLEQLLDFARPKDAAGLRPSSQGQALLTQDDLGSVDHGLGNPSDRNAVESLLMRRVGELGSHLGRYDMYALTVATWLAEKKLHAPLIETLTIRTRGSWISNSLRSLAAPDSLTVEFDDINQQLLTILARQDIAAVNKASIPALRDPGPQRRRAVGGQRDWFDFVGAADEELLSSINSMERDICSVSSLYIRLAGWAGRLSLVPSLNLSN